MSLSLKILALCTRRRRTRRRTRRLRRIKRCGGDRIGPCERGGGCGSLYHLWQGGNRPITNDSCCLNTMSIFDGKDGSYHPSFSKQTFCWFHFHFDKMFFFKSWATHYETGPTNNKHICKHEFTVFWFSSLYASIASRTVDQHWVNIGWMFCAMRDSWQQHRSDRVWVSISFIMFIILTLT